MHGVAEPVIVPGFAGTAGGVTGKLFGAEEAPQLLFATTLIVPPVAVGVTEIEVPVELPCQPDGNVQVYELAPATALIL